MKTATQVAEEKCDTCGVFQGFTISEIRNTFDYVSEIGTGVYYEGWWNCKGCATRNSAQSEVSYF